MINIKDNKMFPKLSDCFTEEIRKKLFNIERVGKEQRVTPLDVYELFIYAEKWKEKYTVIHVDTEEENYFWVKELRGIKFDTEEELYMYCFLDYCNNISKKL